MYTYIYIYIWLCCIAARMWKPSYIGGMRHLWERGALSTLGPSEAAASDNGTTKSSYIYIYIYLYIYIYIYVNCNLFPTPQLMLNPFIHMHWLFTHTSTAVISLPALSFSQTSSPSFIFSSLVLAQPRPKRNACFLSFLMPTTSPCLYHSLLYLCS